VGVGDAVLELAATPDLEDRAHPHPGRRFANLLRRDEQVLAVERPQLGDHLPAPLGIAFVPDRDVEVEQVVPGRGRPDTNHLGYAVPLRLCSPHGELTLLTTLAHFATAIDITVSELSLEAFLPGGAATAEALALADPRGPHFLGSKAAEKRG
jgi:hypothetical protein